MYDAIVVGARCAGAPLAMQLAKDGHCVLLVDKSKFPSDMPMSTHLIHALGMNYLQQWGLYDQIVDTGAPPITRFNVDMGPFSLIGENPAVDGANAGYAPRRLVLDEILVSAAVREGAEFREGVTVTSLQTDGDTITGIQAIDDKGNKFSETARVVIGADGPASVVAKEVKAKKYEEKPALQGTAWTYFSAVPIDELQLYLREYEAVYAFPTSGSTTLVGVNWSIDRFASARSDIEKNYWDLLRRAAPNLAELASRGCQEEVLHLGSTRNFFRQSAGPGWALVGDAGHKKDPCTAQGITDAFVDVEILTDAIKDGLDGKKSFVVSLNEYQEQRDNRAMPFYQLTCDMATFAPPTSEQFQLYTALKKNQTAAEHFFGMVTEAVTPAEFFDPENMNLVMSPTY